MENTDVSSANYSGSEVTSAAKSKRHKIAIFLIVGPFVGMIGTFILFAVMSMVVVALSSSTGPELSASVTVIANLIRIGLGLVGFISILGIFIGVPVGVALLFKK